MKECFDVDLLSYPNLLAYVKELRHTRIKGLFYMCKASSNFILLSNDVDIGIMGSKLVNSDNLHL